MDALKNGDKIFLVYNLEDQQITDSVVVQEGRAIPANFLLDPNGNIIARDLRGKALTDKLAEIFKGKGTEAGGE